MSEIKFCNLCNRNISPKKKFSWLWFILPGLVTGFIGSIVYLLYYWFVKKPACPICEGTSLSAMNVDEVGIGKDGKKAIIL